MRYRVTCDPDLPPMAWCVRLREGADIELLCGTSVELRDDAFFEGAWSGSIEAFDFVDATDVFGSGGQVSGDELIIVPPSHTLERIQFIRRQDETLISNSLVFLLTAARAQLDPRHTSYAADFTNIIHDGLASFDTVTPIRFADAELRGEAHIVYYKNVCFHADGRISFIDKPVGPPFETFADYVALLEESVCATVANAGSPHRATQYSPLASISSGYDSPAVAALARDVGCTRAVTFTHARGHGSAEAEDDSGTPIAELLGCRIKEFQREAYRDVRPFPEAEFLATGMSGEDLNTLPLEDDIHHSVFFSGHYGGRVWDVDSDPDDALRRKDMSGASLNEFRLRTDFVHLAVPFIGARRQPKIFEIGTSDAMKNWSIGTDYDRPVPRRIAEDAGVPRHLFGQKKRATSALLHTGGGSAWTEQTRAAVVEYAKRLRLSPRTRLAYVLDSGTELLRAFAQRVLRRLGLLRFTPALAKPVGIHSHTPLGPLPIFWAIENISPRYTEAVNAWSRPDQ
ncbi:hypothetical protein [Mycobacterium sp. SMC-4]|uniref:hypothetical protein n=1 Tax=Mycobacterium sp. SMC-4 TaxID=2857059 RepID=UPI003D05008D